MAKFEGSSPVNQIEGVARFDFRSGKLEAWKRLTAGNHALFDSRP